MAMRFKWAAAWLAPFLCLRRAIAGAAQRREPPGGHASWFQGWLPRLAQWREARGVDSCQRDGAELVRDGHCSNLLQKIRPRSRAVPSQDRRAVADRLQGKRSRPHRHWQGEWVRCLDGAASLSAASQYRQTRDDDVPRHQGERQLLSCSTGCQVPSFAGSAGTDKAVSWIGERMRCGVARASLPRTPRADRSMIWRSSKGFWSVIN